MRRSNTYSVLALATWVATAACASAPAVRPAPDFIHARVLVIVRHGDIDIAAKRASGNAVPLAPRGTARAQELAYALRDLGVTRIVTSDSVRTQETAAPLAALLHLTPEVPFGHGAEPGAPMSYEEKVRHEADGVVEYLARTSRPDDVVLLVHHHSVIPALLQRLGAVDEPELAESTEFDRLYVVVPDPAHGTYRVARLRYGGTWGKASAAAP